MKLRKGVMFHDGSPFNAQSLKYQMDWIMDKDNAAWTRVWIEPLKSVEVVDDYTRQVAFQKALGVFSRHHGKCAGVYDLRQGAGAGCSPDQDQEDRAGDRQRKAEGQG